MRPWSIAYPDGCRSCGTKRKAHAGHGYCNRCYKRKKVRGLVPTTRRESRIRSRDGNTQFFCYDCSSWKSSLEFRLKKQRTKCNDCRREQRREWYQTNKERLNARRREQLALLSQQVRLGDIMRRHTPDPWAKRAIVPLDMVCAWLEQLFVEHENSWVRVGAVLNMSDRRLRVLRFREISRHGLATENVTVDVAERIARAVDRMDEMRDFLVPGVEGWSKEHLHCQRCGRYDVPHHALGLCKRCYQNRRYHAQRGQDQPLPRGERWATWYHACIRCGRTKYRHQGKGVCSGCYQQVRRERKTA